MSKQRKLVRKLKVRDDFRGDTGIIYTIKPADDVAFDKDSVQSLEPFPPMKDPVKEYAKKLKKRSKTPPVYEKPITPNTAINPSLNTRIGAVHPHPPERDVGTALIKYEAPKLKGIKKAEKERQKRREEEEKMTCDYEVLRLPSPVNIIKYEKKLLEIPSPEVSQAKVMPKSPSVYPDYEYPYPPPTQEDLEPHKPKSGIIINPKEEYYYPSDESDVSETESEKKKKVVEKEDSVVIKQEKEEKPTKTEGKEGDRLSTIYDEDEMWEEMEDWPEEVCSEGEEPFMLDKSTAFDEETVLKQVRKKVSQTSISTSLNSKDLEMYQDVSWDQIPAISKLVQTFRTEQEQREHKPRKKIKKGTLENHSFTKIKQKVLDEFCYRSLPGTIHQGNDNFSVTSRNKQGICISVAAFCYSKLKKPKKWTERIVDEVVEIGDKLYLDSIKTLHIHKDRKELTPQDLENYIYINNKRVKFEIDDPDVNGHIRSLDKRIYNITKGLRIFFRRHKAAILQAGGMSLAIWKRKKYYYMFDANPRRKDLYEDPNGTALLVCVQNIRSLVSILLDRTDLGNATFLLYFIRVVRVLCPHEKEEDIMDAKSEYNILSDRKAVVQGTFDLGDKCFCFSRNKQALTMATVSLVYSRITSPNTWRKQTVDKIMIIGNQLYLECVEAENAVEIELENLPALFTIGPYIVEIFIYANCFADTMYKKCQCSFRTVLEEFFQKNSHAVVQIGKFVLAIWNQRNMFYCFDPYSRNSDGLKCRNGAACVSMNADLDTLVDTVVANFDDKDAIFYVHALKVLRVHRDPAMNRLFPKTRILNEVPIDHFKKCRLKKSKKKAVEKPISTDFSEYAMKKLLATESPGISLIDIGSNIGSLNKAYLPLFMQKLPPKLPIKTKLSEMTDVADLDSPALSETQIYPERPSPMKEEEEITLMDLDAFDLTQEELELQMGEGEFEDEDEGEGEGFMMGAGDYEEQGEGEDDYYLARSAYSQVDSSSLESMHLKMTEEINTDISYQYKILPTLELPLKSKKDADVPLIIDEDLQKAELQKKTNYAALPDNAQILRGTMNISELGQPAYDIAPYLCIMATAYSQEVPLHEWSKRNVDFVLQSGIELYQSFEEPYSKVEDFHLEFTNHTVDLVLEIALDTYVGQHLFDTTAGQETLAALLELHIFSKSSCGVIILPEYCCTVFFKRNVLYLFDCHGCNKNGESEGQDKGTACMLRFRDLDSLTRRILYNRNQRVIENDSPEYSKFILAIPDVVRTPERKVKKKQELYDEDGMLIEPEVTQSQELMKDNNFIDLPDDTQLLRGSTQIGNFGEDDEFHAMAPFICMIAAAVAYKYSVGTWSTEIVNYVLRGGSELYKKANVSFDQVAKLEIPIISLGKTDFSLEVNYLFDAPVKAAILEDALKGILKQNGEWAIIVTQEYVCGAYYRHHLYYLYDGYPTNEVGLSEGPETSGYASLARFKDLKSLVTRIVYNKNKSEEPEKLKYSRFTLSTCKVRFLKPELEHKREKDVKRKAEKQKKQEKYEAEEAPGDDEEEEEEGEKKAEPPKNKIGFQIRDYYAVIEGTKSLEGREAVSEELKEDHFVCLCACLMIINRSIKKWDTKRVDQVIDQGKHIFSHAENLEMSDKRTIKNILVGKHFFDIIVKPVKINNAKKNKNVEMGLRTIMDKRKFCMVQLPNCCIVVYKESDTHFVFDPYSWTYKTKNETKTVQAGWTMYTSIKRLRRKLKSCQVKDGQGQYAFFSFEVISVRKAPRRILMAQKLEPYKVDKPPKQEILGKPFYEQESWLNIHQSPWSRMKAQTASGKDRDSREAKWHNWDIEYPNDLYSLTGNIHQTSRKFKPKNRGKQTLANLIVAIGMINIYELSEWNAAILDSVLVNGDAYFTECAKDIKDDNYELALEDLIETCSIFPYNFKVSYAPAIEGTMFLDHPKKFNLYKALRYFFESYECRYGIIISKKGENKRLASFGKTRENEYFMYDCQATGPPMFYERQGASYILRCVTLARLIHCLVLTMKGGDFFVYEAEAHDFEPMK